MAAYLLDPSVDHYRLRDLAEPHLGIEVDDGSSERARAPSSSSSPDRRGRGHRHGRGGRSVPTCWPPPGWPRSSPVCAPRCVPPWRRRRSRALRRHRAAAGPGAGPHGGGRHPASTGECSARSPTSWPTSASPSRPRSTSWPESRSTSTRSPSCAPSSTTGWASPRGARPRPGSRPTPAPSSSSADQHPIIEILLRYREVEKLRSTYGESLIAEVADDGRIHATFRQTVARTGRLSSDRPNLHNIPVRTEQGRRFREAFIPCPGRQVAGGRLRPGRVAGHRPPVRRSRAQ